MDFIHDNPNFKQFEREAIKDNLSNGISSALGNNASKYIPQPPANTGDTEKEAAKHQRKGKAMAPLDREKKKS
ncbi:hypothetical protein R1flu_028362 [Riccia fluitans]|uniref:Uncharacterized protein n=1 Tax=Riccia fluitans TaxID=41844 RepID=A0ABD1XLF9_9MARC